MGEAFIGDIIRRKRESLRLTQADLADGICSVVSISRIEGGLQSPKLPLLRAILGRLDLPESRYIVWAFSEEQYMESMLRRLEVLVAQYEKKELGERIKIREEATQIIDELERNAGQFDVFTKQRIACAKLTLYKELLSPQESRKRLLKIIQMSCPKFEEFDITRSRYSTDEIKMLNHFGITYLMEGKTSNASSFFKQLYTYVKNNFRNIPASKSYFCSIIANYVRALISEEVYEEAVVIAKEGQRICLDNSYYFPLVEILDRLAEAYFALGEKRKSEQCFFQAYCFAVITEDAQAAMAIEDDFVKAFKREFNPQLALLLGELTQHKD